MKKKEGEVERLAEKPYPMHVYQDPESGDWVAEVQDLPGCIGVAETQEGAVAAAKAFIPDWIEEAISQGWDVPEPTKHVEASGKFVARLPKSLHARLQALAEIEGTSLNQLVVSMLSARSAQQELLAGLRGVLTVERGLKPWREFAYAFEAMRLAVRVASHGTYTTDLRYPEHPALVAETPGFYAWRRKESGIPASRDVRKKKAAEA